ncbi:MAG: hypothetical protein ACI8W8_002920 [Rhodothermales bacterium]|jgi:hypothetical protein
MLRKTASCTLLVWVFFETDPATFPHIAIADVKRLKRTGSQKYRLARAALYPLAIDQHVAASIHGGDKKTFRQATFGQSRMGPPYWHWRYGKSAAAPAMSMPPSQPRRFLLLARTINRFDSRLRISTSDSLPIATRIPSVGKSVTSDQPPVPRLLPSEKPLTTAMPVRHDTRIHRSSGSNQSMAGLVAAAVCSFPLPFRQGTVALIAVVRPGNV